MWFGLRLFGMSLYAQLTKAKRAAKANEKCVFVAAHSLPVYSSF